MNIYLNDLPLTILEESYIDENCDYAVEVELDYDHLLMHVMIPGCSPSYYFRPLRKLSETIMRIDFILRSGAVWNAIRTRKLCKRPYTIRLSGGDILCLLQGDNPPDIYLSDF